MRFDRVFVDRFGPLAGVDTGEAPLGPLVVVTGANEAGKTSFFLALRALIHGLYPASRDANPWAPWDGSDLEIRAHVTPVRGEPFRVHRRLLSSPWGRIRRGEEEEDLRNEAIPPARRIGRRVHEEVYTIGLPDLLRLQEGPGWEKVRDELVTGLGTRDLRPPRDVAAALQARAEGLWRPDRRSRSTEDRQLAARVGEASDRLVAARDRDRRLRGLHRELGEVEEELARLRDTEARHRRVVEEARRLEGPARRLEVLRRRRREAGDPGELDGLPADPAARVEELLVELEAATTAAEEARRRHRDARDRQPELGESARRLLEREELVGAVLGRRDLAGELATRREEEARALEEREAALRSEAADLLEADAAEALAGGDPAVLDGLPGEAALPVLDALDEVRVRRIRAEEAFRESEVDGAEDTPMPRGPVVGTLLLVFGLPALLAGVLGLWGQGPDFTPGTWALALVALAGLLASGWGGHQVLRWRNRREEVRREWDEKARRRQARLRGLEEAREAEAEARQALDELLRPLPLREARRRSADRELLRALEGLARRSGEVRAARQALEAGTRTERELATDTDVLRDALEDPDDPTTHLPSSLVGALEALAVRLERARAEAEQVRAGREEVADTRRTLEAAEAEAARVRDRLEALEGLLPGAVEDGAPQDPLARAPVLRQRARQALQRMEAARDADRIEAELREEAGGAERVARDVEALRAEPLHRDPGPEALAARLDETRARTEALATRAGELRASIRELDEGETPDQVEAEIQQLREAQAEVREARDLAWVLARIVRTAEREFREAHQPELVQRAGRFLGRITGGRYDRLLLGDDADPDSLHLAGPGLPGVLPVAEPFSTGIREQVYLALRLACLEVLEAGDEPLPLVLDEVLVNWDPDRRARALDLLADLSGERQVFLMTCHPHMAREAGERGARVVRLDGASAGSVP